MNMLVAGRVDCPRLDPVCARVRERILQAVRRAASLEDDELMAVARAGREALALEDDSDSDAGPPDGCQPDRRPCRRPPRPAACAAPSVKSVEVAGVSVQAAVIKRVLWLECSADAVRAITDEIARECVPQALRRARKRARATPAGSDGCQPEVPGLTGKVYFAGEKQRWVVCYTNEHGRRAFCQKGLGVSMFDQSGERLPREEYLARLRGKFLMAKRLWNRLDMSERPRLPEESPADSPGACQAAPGACGVGG